MKKINEIKYFSENERTKQKTLNEIKYSLQEDETSWDDKTVIQPIPGADQPDKPIQQTQPQEYQGIMTVNGRKLVTKYDQQKDMISLKSETQPEGIVLHGDNIQKLLKWILSVKKRGE